jgi:hypothetical protein
MPSLPSAIVPLAPAHLEALYAVLDAVARERRGLGQAAAPHRNHRARRPFRARP